VLRRRELLAQLAHYGLLPEADGDGRNLAALDPYALRARGLDRALAPHEIGRVLLHLNRRRGFKSNRKTDRKAQDKSKIAEGAKRLRERLAKEGVRTFGEYLWRRHGGPDGAATPRSGNRETVRIRLEGEGAKALYDIYPTREMLQDEFDQLLVAQSTHHPQLVTPEVVAALRHVIFRQRPLKPVPVGRCTLEPTEPRLPKAMPSVEARVIYEALNHLRYGEGLRLDNRLDRTERDLLAATLLQGKSLSFDKLRSILKLSATALFSLEEGGKSDLKDFASKSAAAMTKKERFGPRWLNLTPSEQDAIVQRLLEDENDGPLVEWLQERHGLDQAAVQAVLGWVPPDGVSRLGATANAAVLAELRTDHCCTYDQAVRRGGEKFGRPWHHSDSRTGEIQRPLPYYGRVLERHVSFGSGNPEDADEQRYGRLPNPTVHIALGQLRRIMNRLIAAYGEPEQIVVELSRELKQSKAQKEEERRRNNEHRKANDLRREALEKLGQQDTGENRLRLRLFEEQQRANGGVALCPYSSKPISIEKLFSSEVDVDHILPYSRTLDDTAANRIVCYRAANRVKRSKSPFEAFGTTQEWSGILAAAANLPRNKRWRFAPDAMERFERTERDFLARQLNETRHLSRLARLYLGAACDPDNVYVTTGQLTAMLRARWGLNSILGDENRKVRNDHRHHAIDAVAVGAMDRSLLQELARRAGLAELEERSDVTRGVPEPFAGFRDAVREKVLATVVSLKPEHGKSGALHEDTAYGLIKDEAEAAEIGNLVFRKPLVDLNLNEIERVRDPILRQALLNVATRFRDKNGKLGNAKGLRASLEAFAKEPAPGRMQGVRRVRIGKEKSGEVHVRDRRTGAFYKALVPGENHHIDIVQMRDGAWVGFAATVFEVNQRGWRPVWERDRLGGKLVMRLHKGDMIEVYDTDGERRVKVVHRLSPSNNVLYLAGHSEGGELQRRHDNKDDLFRWDFANVGGLKKRKARKVKIDEMGRLALERSNVSLG
jgi:CRISPR-associated endonuclease Csn1